MNLHNFHKIFKWVVLKNLYISIVLKFLVWVKLNIYIKGILIVAKIKDDILKNVLIFNQ